MTNIRTSIGLVALFLLLSACDSGKLDKGSNAPDFKLKDVAQATHQLSEYKGKVVWVHFWTDWCKSCRAEFPKIEATYSSLKNKANFELLAINVGQPATTSAQFQKDFSASFPMLVDEQGIMKDLYQVEAYPTNYFISPDGKVIRRIIGWLTQNQVEVILAAYEQ